MPKYIIEIEPGNYLVAFTSSNRTASGTFNKPDAKRFDNVYRAGDARDEMKRQHGFDEARIVEVSE